MNKKVLSAVVVAALVFVLVVVSQLSKVAVSPTPTPTSFGDSDVQIGKKTFVDGLTSSFVDADAYAGDKKSVASGSYSFTAEELCGKTLVVHDGDGYASSQQAKWPSASTLISKCLANVGDKFSLLYFNTSDDEVISLTPAGRSGIDYLVASSGGNTVEVTTDRMVEVTFYNFNGSTVSLTFDEFKDND